MPSHPGEKQACVLTLSFRLQRDPLRPRPLHPRLLGLLPYHRRRPCRPLHRRLGFGGCRLPRPDRDRRHQSLRRGLVGRKEGERKPELPERREGGLDQLDENRKETEVASDEPAGKKEEEQEGKTAAGGRAEVRERPAPGGWA